MKAVFNTSPLCYLVLIELIDIVPEIFHEILTAESVITELSHPDSPAPVRKWADDRPSWLDVHRVDLEKQPELAHLHRGEADAIALARTVESDWVVLDDMEARKTAAALGLQVIGLLGILDIAATKALIDLPQAVQRLDGTSFYVSSKLLKQLLAKHAS